MDAGLVPGAAGKRDVNAVVGGVVGDFRQHRIAARRIAGSIDFRLGNVGDYLVPLAVGPVGIRQQHHLKDIGAEVDFTGHGLLHDGIEYDARH